MAGFYIGLLLFTAAATTSVPVDYSTTTLKAFALKTAAERGLNKEHFLATLSCESGFGYDAVGDDGLSTGIAQINRGPDAHPEVTYKQAINPYWSIQWMAKEWLAGRAWQWTCWNLKPWLKK